MSRDPKNDQPRADAVEVKPEPRRAYTAPCLKRLGSVRDLTLGSPAGKVTDGLRAKRSM